MVLGMFAAGPMLRASGGEPTDASAAAPAAALPRRQARRRDEAVAFRAFAEATHPRGRDAAADQDWRRRWESLQLEAERLSDGAYFHRVRRCLGWFRDGHTTVLPFEFVGGVPPALASGAFRLGLPLRLRVFDDGVRVVAATGDAAPLLGSRLARIGSRTPDELIRTLAVDWPGNDAWAQRWSAGTLASPAFLEALGAVTDPTAPIVFEGTTGNVNPVRAKVQPRPESSSQLTALERTPWPNEAWAVTAGRDNYVRMLDDGVCYLSIDDMADVEGETFEALTREVFDVLRRPDLQRVVLDLRRNGGGNNFFGEALRKGIGRSRFNRPGGLYILVGPRTFSAAQNLANRLERETFAFFVGGPTGGAPNHYGDAKVLAGEATGITIMVSTLAWFDSYPQDERPWILPDLPVADTFEDWRSGTDRALTAALGHRTDGAADELSRERIFYFRRPSQQRSWNPFWRVDSAARHSTTR
jgi:hypothetical protein